MIAFRKFTDMDPSFWAFIKIISEHLGYTNRGANSVKTYTYDEIDLFCRNMGLNRIPEEINAAVVYSSMRADLLNNYAKKMLMTGEEASYEFRTMEQIHRAGAYLCKLPLNKQKGEMRQIAFFTAMINIIAEKTIREITGRRDLLGFNDDPRGLSYIYNVDGTILGALSRRFDGAFPDIVNPKLVWEIKEYYYNKSFGSRVADGVYETQLDGYEFKELYERTGIKVYHVLFIDSYQTWWEMGKSYLCRLVDAINSGVVDEVLVGKEIFSRWPELLREQFRN